MKNIKNLPVKVLEVFTWDINHKLELNEYSEDEITSSFEAIEFENGLILIVGQESDWFFSNREDIECCGTDVVKEIKVSHADTYSSDALLASVQCSIRCYGVESVDKKHLALWR